jgi:hypothetical protein
LSYRLTTQATSIIFFIHPLDKQSLVQFTFNTTCCDGIEGLLCNGETIKNLRMGDE